MKQLPEMEKQMSYLSQEQARVYQRERLEEARSQRMGYQLARARRLSRRAERAAAAARLALARAL
jgi:hypothetical protein